RFEQPMQFIRTYRPPHDIGALQFGEHRCRDAVQLLVGCAYITQSRGNLELGDKLRGAVRTFERRQSGTAGVKANSEALRRRTARLRRYLDQNPHPVRRRDARGAPGGDIPVRTDLMTQGVRDAEAGVHGAENREPRRKLALYPMLQLFGSCSRQRRPKML